jgi:hypothetical protein
LDSPAPPPALRPRSSPPPVPAVPASPLGRRALFLSALRPRGGVGSLVSASAFDLSFPSGRVPSPPVGGSESPRSSPFRPTRSFFPRSWPCGPGACGGGGWGGGGVVLFSAPPLLYLPVAFPRTRYEPLIFVSRGGLGWGGPRAGPGGRRGRPRAGGPRRGLGVSRRSRGVSGSPASHVRSGGGGGWAPGGAGRGRGHRPPSFRSWGGPAGGGGGGQGRWAPRLRSPDPGHAPAFTSAPPKSAGRGRGGLPAPTGDGRLPSGGPGRPLVQAARQGGPTPAPVVFGPPTSRVPRPPSTLVRRSPAPSGSRPSARSPRGGQRRGPDSQTPRRLGRRGWGAVPAPCRGSGCVCLRGCMRGRGRGVVAQGGRVP